MLGWRFAERAPRRSGVACADERPGKRIIGCDAQAGLTIALLIPGFGAAVVILLSFWIVTHQATGGGE
jgi:hypothetical protein